MQCHSSQRRFLPILFLVLGTPIATAIGGKMHRASQPCGLFYHLPQCEWPHMSTPSYKHLMLEGVPGQRNQETLGHLCYSHPSCSTKNGYLGILAMGLQISYYCVNHLQISKHSEATGVSSTTSTAMNRVGRVGHQRGTVLRFLSWCNQGLLRRSAGGKLEFMQGLQTSKIFGS